MDATPLYLVFRHHISTQVQDDKFDKFNGATCLESHIITYCQKNWIAHIPQMKGFGRCIQEAV